jgi:hypothetical protein
MYGIMYRTPVIIRKISPDRANLTPTRSGGVLLRPEGAEYAGVDKLPDYLRSLTAVIICLATVNYQKIFHARDGAFHSSRVINKNK